MNRPYRGWLIALALSSACSSTEKPVATPAPARAIEPKPSLGAACYTGLPSKVQDDCGCGPAQREIEVALKETHLVDLVRKQVIECLNGNLPLGVVTASVVGGKVDGCVRKAQELDPPLRDQLIAVVSDALAKSSKALPDQDAWVTCYTNHVAPAPRAEPLATKYAQKPIQLGANRLSIDPPETASNGKVLYRWTLWVRDLDEMLPDLKEIYYSFDHPTFEGNVPSSANRNSSFRVEYRGWGCVEKVTATLVFNDDSRLAKPFNQCNVSGGPTKGGGFGSGEGTPGTAAPIRKCLPGEDPGPPMVQGPPKCVM
jgi:hypothetical protein